MAYKYVPWAAGVDGLKISTKGVLMVLTDCAFIARDEKTGKELGYGLVTLKRATIAEKCGWAKQSVKSLDRELDILEERRLIRRRRNKNPETNHRTPSDIHVLWKPWGDRTEDEGIAEDDAEPMVTSTPQGQTTTGVNNRPPRSNDHRGYGQTTTGGYGQTTTKEQGSSNKVLSRVSGEALTAASFLSEEMRAWAQENHPHVNVDQATEKYVAWYSGKTTSRKSWEKWIAQEKTPKPSAPARDPLLDVLASYMRQRDDALAAEDAKGAEHWGKRVTETSERIKANSSSSKPQRLPEYIRNS